MRVTTKLFLIVLWSAIGGFAAGFALALYFQRDPAGRALVYQQIEVPDPSAGKSEAGTNGYEFSWNEITAGRDFQRELARRVLAPEDVHRLLPPRFEAGTSFEPLKDLNEKLTLAMPKDLNVFYMSGGTPEQLFRDFDAGMQLYLERLRTRGIEGKPIDRPQIAPVWKPNLRYFAQTALYFSVLPAIAAGLMGYFTAQYSRR